MQISLASIINLLDCRTHLNFHKMLFAIAFVTLPWRSPIRFITQCIIATGNAKNTALLKHFPLGLDVELVIELVRPGKRREEHWTGTILCI